MQVKRRYAGGGEDSSGGVTHEDRGRRVQQSVLFRGFSASASDKRLLPFAVAYSLKPCSLRRL